MAVTYDPIHARWKSTRDGGESYFSSQAEAEAYDRPPQPGQPGSVGGPPVVSTSPMPGTTGGSYGGSVGGGGSGSMSSLLSADDQYRLDQRNATDAELARTAEANRLAIATADRLSKEGLSAAEIAARMRELQTGGQITDTNAANASARAAASRTEMLNRIPGLMASITGGTGGGGAAPAATDSSAANAAAFANAKDQTAAIGRGAITGMREGLAERGGLGGGMEGGGMASLMGENARRLGDTTRQQTISDVDTQNRRADRNYAGDLTKRGQNLGVSSSILSLLGSRAY